MQLISFADRLDFYPRPPGGGRQGASCTYLKHHLYFYPRPPGGGRLTTGSEPEETVAISIHALRVEGDVESFQFLRAVLNFYPRPPGGGRLCVLQIIQGRFVFLSTPSGWRATTALYPHVMNDTFLSTPSGWRATFRKGAMIAISGISIHALRVEGDIITNVAGNRRAEISIHALRVEGDRELYAVALEHKKFLSTSSGWRATFRDLENVQGLY